MSLPLSSLAIAVQPSIVRIVVTTKQGERTVGTGFCFGSGRILTCAHVLLAKNSLFTLLQTLGNPPEPEEALRTFYKDTISTIDAYDMQGAPLDIQDVVFNGAMDVGVLIVSRNGDSLLSLDISAPTELGEDIVTCGYPYTIQTPETNYPYAIAKGTISTIADVHIGGYRKRPFLQAFLPILGGASGSPVFSLAGDVIGIINGQMQWGADNHVFMETKNGKSTMIADALYVPLPIAFITPISRAMEVVTALMQQQ